MLADWLAPFADRPDLLLDLDAMAKRWGQLPSELLKLPPEEMSINLMVLDEVRSRQEERLRGAKGLMGVAIVADADL